MMKTHGKKEDTEKQKRHSNRGVIIGEMSRLGLYVQVNVPLGAIEMRFPHLPR